MKFLQTIRKNMVAMGFAPNQQQNSHRRFSSRQIFFTAKYFIDIIVIGVYIFCEADRNEEYMESVFSLTAVVGATIVFISVTAHNDKLFDILELVADEGNFSKCSKALPYA